MRSFTPSAPTLAQLQALHRLNDLAPDGGSRIPEAEAAYRAAMRLADPSAASALVIVQGNLGVLLLSGGRMEDALTELTGALAAAERLGLPKKDMCGMMFNRGKTLAAAGRLEEAEAAYLEAARAAYGSDLPTYGKSLAALEALPADAMKEAAQVW